MRIAGLLLAAGGGRRFGGCKQLAPVDGKPLVRHGLEALAPLFPGHLYVVLGAWRDQIRPRVEDLAEAIDHEHWRDGLGSSIAAGVTQIKSRGRYDGILVGLADQFRLTTDDYARLVDRFDGDQSVAAHYAGSAGVPALFASDRYPLLEQLRGDRGAKPMLQQLAAELITVPMPAAAQDIDTPADLPDSKGEADGQASRTTSDR